MVSSRKTRACLILGRVRRKADVNVVVSRYEGALRTNIRGIYESHYFYRFACSDVTCWKTPTAMSQELGLDREQMDIEQMLCPSVPVRFSFIFLTKSGVRQTTL